MSPDSTPVHSPREEAQLALQMGKSLLQIPLRYANVYGLIIKINTLCWKLELIIIYIISHWST